MMSMSHISRVFLSVFLGLSISKRPFQINFLDFVVAIIVLSCSCCGPIRPKLTYMNSEYVPKFDIRMRLSGLYLSSEDVTYSSSEPSYLSDVVEFEVARSRSNFGRFAITRRFIE